MAAGARTMIDFPRPAELSESAFERDGKGAEGDYRSALVKQKQVERLKNEEEEKQTLALTERQQDEVVNLDNQHATEYDHFLKCKEVELSTLFSRHQEQLKAVEDRHVDEHNTFMMAATESKPKAKWSSQLLNKRKIEEHLIRQKEWAKATKTKKEADAMEAKEAAFNLEAWMVKIGLEEAKMLQRQAKEASGMNDKLRSVQNEFAVQRNKDLAQRQKKWNAGRCTLVHTHALERQQLDNAIKSWYNPKRPDLFAAPLSPLPTSPMSPGHRLAAKRRDVDSPFAERSAPPSPSRTDTSPSKLRPPKAQVALISPFVAKGLEQQVQPTAGSVEAKPFVDAFPAEGGPGQGPNNVAGDDELAAPASGGAVMSSNEGGLEDLSHTEDGAQGATNSTGEADNSAAGGRAQGATDSTGEGSASVAQAGGDESGTTGDEPSTDGAGAEVAAVEAGEAVEAVGGEGGEGGSESAGNKGGGEDEVTKGATGSEGEAGEEVAKDVDASNSSAAGPIAEGTESGQAAVPLLLRPKSRISR